MIRHSEAIALSRFKDEGSRRCTLMVSNPGSPKKPFDIPTGALARIRLRTSDESPVLPAPEPAPATQPQPSQRPEPSLPRRKPLSFDLRIGERGAEALLFWTW